MCVFACVVFHTSPKGNMWRATFWFNEYLRNYLTKDLGILNIFEMYEKISKRYTIDNFHPYLFDVGTVGISHKKTSLSVVQSK